MKSSDVVVVTGAAGFIGSYLTGYLNQLGFTKLVLVDDFSNLKKTPNLASKKYSEKVHREQFFTWLGVNHDAVQFVFHLGARTDTTEMDYAIHKKLNLDYSKDVWALCALYNIPLVYASSAATYGNGEKGYSDDHNIVNSLEPLNPYGLSKNQFDAWALEQANRPPFWAGLKFFNVFGPNEYHKGRMASVVYHAYNQIVSNGTVKLFRSHNPAFRDGEQMRDFIYVKDVVSVCMWLMDHRPKNGLYNLGSGKARTFKDLATAIFNSMRKPVSIEYIDTPEDIRDKYQYFTQADMSKLKAAGYHSSFSILEDAVHEYVTSYLQSGRYF